jgi:hypothetical protein
MLKLLYCKTVVGRLTEDGYEQQSKHVGVFRILNMSNLSFMNLFYVYQLHEKF